MIDKTIENEDEYIYEEEGESDKIDSKIKKGKSELRKCQAEKQEYLDGWQRSKADYINLKKRSEDEKSRIREYGNEEIINDLLSVVDSFEMAFKDKEAWNNAPETWRVGIEFIYNQMMKVLENNGATPINPLGEKFDPEKHHSSEIIEVDDESQDGIVIEVIQKGYQLKDRNIRPASVKVGEFKK